MRNPKLATQWQASMYPSHAALLAYMPIYSCTGAGMPPGHTHPHNLDIYQVFIWSETQLTIDYFRCVEENLAPGYEGCYADVLNTAHRKCSGRNSCALSIPDPDFEATKPCSELQNYLETKYQCLKGTVFLSCGLSCPGRSVNSEKFIMLSQ